MITRSFVAMIFSLCVVSIPVAAQDEGPSPDYVLQVPVDDQALFEAPPALPPDTTSSEDKEAIVPPLPHSQVIEQVNQDVDQEMKRLDKVEGGIPSLLFTDGEYATLLAAISSYRSGNVLNPDDLDPDVLVPQVVSRHLVLAGISYGDENNWVIWLNGMRMTPNNLSSEVRDIKVYKTYIEVRWFDDVTQSLIPVRLRPNQRFNLDSQSFHRG
jgi:hypothetical protein